MSRCNGNLDDLMFPLEGKYRPKKLNTVNSSDTNESTEQTILIFSLSHV